MVAQKPLSNFDLLLFVLRDTDNDSLAKLLEQALKTGTALNFPVHYATRHITLPIINSCMKYVRTLQIKMHWNVGGNDLGDASRKE